MTDSLYLTELQNQYLEAEIIEICQRQKPITVRGLYYACVLSRDLPFLTKDSDGGRRNYRLVQTRVLKLRNLGLLP